MPRLPNLTPQSDYERFLTELKRGSNAAIIMPKWHQTTPARPQVPDPQDKEFETGYQLEECKVGAASAGRMTLFFPHGSTSLLPAHVTLLDSLGSQLKPTMWIEMYSITDRTGSQAVNYIVSRDRLNAVKNRLIAARAPRHLVNGPQNKYFGEDFVAAYGREDDDKFAKHRSVTIYVWLDGSTSRYIFSDRPLVAYGRSHKQP